MKKVCLLVICCVILTGVRGQAIASRLAEAVSQLEKDPQLQAALVSIYIVDQSTGKMVFEKNSRYGVAPASAQKIVTAAASLAMLGQEYRYKTKFNLFKESSTNTGIIEVIGSGDPSLGSWRYASSSSQQLLEQFTRFVMKTGSGIQWKGIYANGPTGSVARGVMDVHLPDGYIWQDIGNYYGAGTSGLNWNENQYDIIFKSGKTGDTTAITALKPMQDKLLFRNYVTAGKAGSGDNAFIYAAPFSAEAVIRGTVPPGRSSFSISGSMPDPAYSFLSDLRRALLAAGAKVDTFHSAMLAPPVKKEADSSSFIYQSPGMDSLVYWFLRKSINLYGEAFVRTIALQQAGTYDAETGLHLIKKFWIARGIPSSQLNIADGSGLSPQNRVTTEALVKVLQFAKTQPWFKAFYDALPVFNGMKMKSGSINGARAYTGYHTAASGNAYSFAIVVNNYEGSSSAVVSKMFKVLDHLK